MKTTLPFQIVLSKAFSAAGPQAWNRLLILKVYCTSDWVNTSRNYSLIFILFFYCIICHFILFSAAVQYWKQRYTNVILWLRLISQHSECSLHRYPLVALKRAGLLVMRWGCRLEDGQSYCSCSKRPPSAFTAMQAVQRLMKFATALLMCSCGSSSHMVCRAAFNSSVVLDFGWNLWCVSSMTTIHDSPDVLVQCVQIDRQISLFDIKSKH